MGSALFENTRAPTLTQSVRLLFQEWKSAARPREGVWLNLLITGRTVRSVRHPRFDDDVGTVAKFGPKPGKHPRLAAMTNDGCEIRV